MDIPETLNTLATQEKDKQNKTQHDKLKKISNTTLPKSEGEPYYSRRVSSSSHLESTHNVTHVVQMYLTPLCANEHK